MMYRGSTQATTKFPLSFWTWIWFLGIRLQEGSPTFDKVSDLEQSWWRLKEREFTFSATLSLPSPFSDLNVPIEFSSVFCLHFRIVKTLCQWPESTWCILSKIQNSKKNFSAHLIAYHHFWTVLELIYSTVTDLTNDWHVCLILGVQAGVFNRWEAFKRERPLLS